MPAASAVPAPPSHFTSLDWMVLVAYFVATMGIGLYFYRKSRSPEGFTAASRSLPGWVCGLSIFATFLSSISFLALPGKSFVTDWNAFTFSLSLPLAAWLAVRYFMPYYRRSGEVSAYALLEHRFGVWARIYVSLFYLLTQLVRMGAVMFLMALPLSVLLGWDIRGIIVVTGVSVTLYTLVGGIVAVIWTDALQAIVLMGGALMCLCVILAGLPGGPEQLFEVARTHGKFSLGNFGPSLGSNTFWVVLIYGLFTNLQNFGIDQSYIQRYIASRSDRDAAKSVWLGAMLYIPVSALFFLIGTSLFAFYSTRPGDRAEIAHIVAEQRMLREGTRPGDPEYATRLAAVRDSLSDADIGDRVFPHFIGKYLPPGVTGLLIASIFAAAMSTISTSLNSSATLLMTDYYQRFARPDATEKQAMVALYAGTFVWGALGTGIGLLLIGVQSALDAWWLLSGIFSGGMLGLFLLGMLCRRAHNTAAVLGVCAGLCVIGWMSLPEVIKYLRQLDAGSLGHAWGVQLAGVFEGRMSTWHGFLIPVVGTSSILLVGTLAARLFRRSPPSHAAKKAL